MSKIAKERAVNMKKTNLRSLTQGGIIAALYVAMTLAPGLSSIAFGPIQIRFSEALTILPLFTGSAVGGLFVGCAVSNLIGGGQIIDVILGSLATLLASYLTLRLKEKRVIALFSPVIINALIVGAYLPILYPAIIPVPFPYSIPFAMATVGLGEAIAVYVIGLPLSYLLDKYKGNIFEK